jgi:hypothetical protein
MRVIGFSMVVVAVAMVLLARPRHGTAVHWLRSETRQWTYVMTIVVLIAVGFAISLFGR